VSVTQRPPDFEPLASSDPVPGDTDEIAALGRRYTDTAAEIQAQAANLERLASGTIQGWTGRAAQVFQSRASDLATRIAKAQERYATAGQALSQCAGPMYTYQQSAYAAVWKAKDAAQAMLSNAPGPPPPTSSPPPTAEEKAAAAKHATAYDEAATDLKNATAQFQDAVNDYHDAAGKAARAIRDEISRDGLKDSWWDRNFGWISKAFMIIGIIVIVLAVVALVLICPLSAAFIAGLIGAELTATISAAIGWTILGLTAAQAIFDGIAAGTGKESWTSFILDIVSMATVGLGEGLGQVGKLLPEVDGLLPRLLEPLTEGAEGAAKSVSAGRAGRAFMSGQGLPGVLYSLGSRSGLVATVMDWAGQGGKLAGAVDAASAARETIETLAKGTEPGNLLSVFAMSSDAAEDWAKLSALGGKVPGVVRIVVPQAIAGTAIALEGGVQWASFIGGNSYQIHSWVQGDDSAASNQTIGDFRQMISQVPVP
jgi:uncharacterized protein YukE